MSVNYLHAKTEAMTSGLAISSKMRTASPALMYLDHDTEVAISIIIVP